MKKSLIIFSYILLFSVFAYSSDFLIKFVCMPLNSNGIKPVLFNLTDGLYIRLVVSTVFTFILLNPLLLWKLLNHLPAKWKLSHKKFLMFAVCYSSFLIGIILSYAYFTVHVFQINFIISPDSDRIIDVVMFINNLAAICPGIGLVFELISILIFRISAGKRI